MVFLIWALILCSVVLCFSYEHWCFALLYGVSHMGIGSLSCCVVFLIIMGIDSLLCCIVFLI